MKDIYIFSYLSVFLKDAKFIPLTDPPVYNSCNLLIFIDIIKNTNEASKNLLPFFTKIM